MTLTSLALTTTTTSSLDPLFIGPMIGAAARLLGLIFFTIGWVRSRISKNWVRTTGLRLQQHSALG